VTSRTHRVRGGCLRLSIAPIWSGPQTRCVEYWNGDGRTADGHGARERVATLEVPCPLLSASFLSWVIGSTTHSNWMTWNFENEGNMANENLSPGFWILELGGHCFFFWWPTAAIVEFRLRLHRCRWRFEDRARPDAANKGTGASERQRQAKYRTDTRAGI
jgi:hypothetical protein